MPKKQKSARKLVNMENEIQDALQRNKGYSELYIAVSRGNFCGLRGMIRSGADLSTFQSASGETIIYAAIKSKNARMVAELIRAGVDPNVATGKQTTPLGYAISFDSFDVVEVLVKNGADIHRRFKGGKRAGGTALHVAADFGFVKICEFLIEQGLDVNTRSQYDKTALHVAIISGKTQVVEMLIAKGADICATCSSLSTTEGKTNYGSNISPLFLATFYGNLAIVAALLKAGADVNVTTSENFTVLHLATLNKSLEVMNMLLNAGAGNSVNVQSNHSLTPLFIALAHDKDTSILEVLLKVEGIEINQCISDNNNVTLTPLILASTKGSLDAVKLLLASGVRVNDHPENGITALHAALAAKQDNIVELLIEHGADIHALTDGTVTLLHAACQGGVSLEIIKTLIAKGQNVNAKGMKGETPLHLAAQCGHFETVKILVDNGADVNSADEQKWTSLHYAADGGNLSTVLFLVIRVSEIDAMSLSLTTPLQCAIYKGHHHVVEILLKNGANINAQDDIKCAALHIAVENEHQEIAELLLKRNACVNLTNEEGCTPLFLAVLNNHEKLVNLLLDAGANVNIPNKFGVWPIHLAADAENVSVVEALLAKGAHYDIKAEAKNFSGTPLDFARKVDNAKIIIILEIIKKLFSAVRKNKTSRIILCIEAGAIVNARNANGRTALHFAVSNDNIKAVKALLAGGADMGLASNRGFLPLHIAVEKGYIKITEILLENARNLSFLKRKAVVNAKVGTGMPFHTASKSNNFHIVRLLLMNGGFYNAKNKHGKTPLELMTKDTEIESLLKSVEKLFAAVKKEDGLEEVLEILKENSSALNAREADNGRTPLYWSIAKSHTDIASALLSKGADHSLVTNKGETPLHVAASKGNVEIVKLLINYAKKDDAEKANDFINATTVDGTTALHFASTKCVIMCLLQAGATYNICDYKGATAMELAQNDDVKELLEVVHRIFVDVKYGASTVINSLNALGVETRMAILSIRNAQQQSLVQVALANSHVEIAKELIKLLK